MCVCMSVCYVVCVGMPKSVFVCVCVCACACVRSCVRTCMHACTFESIVATRMDASSVYMCACVHVCLVPVISIIDINWIAYLADHYNLCNSFNSHLTCKLPLNVAFVFVLLDEMHSELFTQHQTSK